MFNLHNDNASLIIPRNFNFLEETAYLGVGAHPDDVEFMCWQGILKGLSDRNNRFASVVVTTGGGSSRTGPYASCSDEEMVKIRHHEQEKVAMAGEYSFAVNLGYTSAELRRDRAQDVVDDLKCIIAASRPRVIYTHNLADRHDSHVAAALRVIQALRELGPDCYPQAFYGCEVWRGLEWLTDEDRLTLDVEDRPHFMNAMMGLYDSQIAGGKRYDLATAGRKRANATYNDAYHGDTGSFLELAMDLYPLLRDTSLEPQAYLQELQERFVKETRERLQRLTSVRE